MMARKPLCRLPTKCIFCAKILSSRNSVYTHIRQYHTREKPFDCNTCGKTFSSQGVSRAHQKRHGERNFECSKVLCGKRFHTKTHLKRHIDSHSTEKRFSCAICKARFKVPSSLKTHHSNVHLKGRKRKFKCQTCSKLFYTEGCLRSHRKIHASNRPIWKCRWCNLNRYFYSNSSLQLHIAKQHFDQADVRCAAYICVFCNKKYYSKAELYNHISSHAHENPNFCQICPAEFRTREGLRYHVEAYHKKNRTREFHCELCRNSFFTKAALFDHINRHTGERPFKCQHCGKCFLTNGALKAHEIYHFKQGPFKCPVCFRRFFTKTSLKNCLKRHDETTVISKCPTCSKEFSKLSKYQTHVNYHGHKKRRFSCGIGDCSFIACSNYLLQKHKKCKHENMLQFVCALCGIKCHSSGHVLQHLRSHTGEKPYFCQKCGREFPNVVNLNRHLLTHELKRERNFSCQLCPKTFFDKHALKFHIGSHTTEKPFSCGVCQKTFRIRPKLARHMKIHTAEKAFGCFLCGKGFSENCLLLDHIRRHIGEKPFNCVFCEMEFADSANQIRHQKTVHRSAN